MGHESITTTARIYSHLYDDELDSIGATMVLSLGTGALVLVALSVILALTS